MGKLPLRILYICSIFFIINLIFMQCHVIVTLLKLNLYTRLKNTK